MKAPLSLLLLNLLVTVDLTADQPSPKLWSSQSEPSPTPAGKVAAGDILTAADAIVAADGDYTGQAVYLVGDFVVTARAKDRAVLRFASNITPAVRIIVVFPPATPFPKNGARFTRDDSNGFLITELRRSRSGEVTIHVRDIVLPKAPDMGSR